jgi:hypothetical protein
MKKVFRNIMIFWLLAAVLIGISIGSRSWVVLAEQQPGPPTTLPIPPGMPFDLPDGVPAGINPGERVSIVTPGNAVIDVLVGKAVTINVTSSRGPPEELPAEANATLPEGISGGLDLYLSIELNDTETSVDAGLHVPYTDANVTAANLREDSLVLHYWDPEAGEWKPIENPGINTAENYVTGNTTHFSIWTILGTTTEPVTTTEEPVTTPSLTNVPEISSFGVITMIGIMISIGILAGVRKRGH